MERIRTLTGTLVATLLYCTSIGVEAKVLSCEATKGNGRGWIPKAFQIDVSNDRKTANVISPVTDVFGAKPFEKSFLGSSLWSRGKGKSKMGEYYNYQLRLDLDSNDTEAKVVMTMQGYRDNELRFRCYANPARMAQFSGNTSSRANVDYRKHEAKSDYDICYMIAENSDHDGSYISEARHRGLTCGSKIALSQEKVAAQFAKALQLETSVNVCLRALDVSAGWRFTRWSNKDNAAVDEAKRRDFDLDYCKRITSSFRDEPNKFDLIKRTTTRLISQTSNAVQTSTHTPRLRSKENHYGPHQAKSDFDVCYMANEMGRRDTSYALEASWRGLTCGNQYLADNIAAESNQTVGTSAPAKPIDWSSLSEDVLCFNLGGSFAADVSRELISRQLDCGLGALTAYTNRPKPEVEVSQDELRELRNQLARLQTEKNTQQKSITQDTQSPSIRITASNSDGARGTISGIATDNIGIAEVLIDGQAVAVDSGGRFTTSTFIPSGGIDVQITAYDLKGLSTTQTVRLERTKRTQTVSRLASVNPLVGPKQKPSRDRAALIIGLEKYASAPSADFASRDAQMFADYAREKLGIPDGNIKILTDSEAEETAILRALKVWLPKAVKPDTTDLYVFYAGHGMPTADGTSAYLVPYDGDIQLLEDTAISRKRFFDEISATKPRSATFFFDNCFSGATRSEELLLASRPLGIKVQETSIPDNYLVFAAGETDQIAGVEPEVKHGRFSYFVFKGLEGEADANSDGKISAGELHKYVRESVGRFSAGAQTPTMLGDKGRWVLR